MSRTHEPVVDLVERREIRVSLHGQEELQADDITIRGVVSGLQEAKIVENYPDY